MIRHWLYTQAVYALDNKGVALYRLGNYTGAIKYYDKALAIDPKDVHSLYNKALALGSLENYMETITYFDKALKIEPHHVYALYDKGNVLYKLGNYAGAINIMIKRWQEIQTLLLRYITKTLLLIIWETCRSYKYYDKALAVDPNNLHSLYNKDLALDNLGNYTLAI